LSDIVQGAWTLRMSGQLRSLPGSQIFVEFVLGLSKFRTELPNVVLGGRFPVGGRGGKFLDLLFDLSDRLFKFEIIAHSLFNPVQRSAKAQPEAPKIAKRVPLCLALPQHPTQNGRWRRR